ncbi:MAG: hypothetical protein AB9921_06260 [Erysipelotrichaceae bacterium]
MIEHAKVLNGSIRQFRRFLSMKGLKLAKFLSRKETANSSLNQTIQLFRLTQLLGCDSEDKQHLHVTFKPDKRISLLE